MHARVGRLSPSNLSRRDKLALFLATGCGVGFVPVAPGTWGSLLGVPVYWLLAQLSLWTQFSLWVKIAGFCLLGGLAVGVAQVAGSVLDKADAPEIVIDEVLGMAVTLAGSPAISPAALIMGFFFFRLFDIWKPFPIRQLEAHIPGGWGVVLDDVVAGVFANLSWRLALGMF